MAVDTCALYGGSTYASGWLGVNFTVILVGLLTIAAVYMFSRYLPTNIRTRFTSMVRGEIIQMVISGVIIMVLALTASTVCGVSSSLSQGITGQQMSPFQFADYYIGNLTFNTGMGMLSQVYTDAMSSALTGQLYYASAQALLNIALGGYLNKFNVGTPLFKLKSGAPAGTAVYVTPYIGTNIGVTFAILSKLYLDIFSPILIVTTGAMLLQYILVPLAQYTAFVIILPIAIALRSIAFAGAGGGLRSAANSMIAIAVAFYIVYPLTISMDAYIMTWMFSSSNPSYQYLHTFNFSISNLPPTFFQQAVSSTSATTVTIPGFSISPYAIGFLGNILTGNYFISNFLTPWVGLDDLTAKMATFIFQAIVLFALNLGITIAFAVNLSKALNAGIEGATPLWSGI
ncbi:MAG: hypothetical protein KGH98_00870 [Candidatus Micrarchaeota archaeon]|nr:hypothetical protein [Candidatus Micrarchaeota archaeon]